MTRSAIVFCAAGSGGHVFAAIATLKAFQAQYPTLAKDLVFVGSTLTMEGEKRQQPLEERLCNRLGIPFRKIRMGKLQRQLSWHSLTLAAKAFLGFVDAWKLLRELRPKVIAAFGGYVSLPIVIVGKLLGAKVIIHEQTSSLGLTNKILQKYADVVAVAFSTSLPFFKKPAVVVGSPTMEHIYNIKDYAHLIAHIDREKGKLLDESEYLEQLKWLSEQEGKTPILLMSGGSQGSHFLNERIREILPALLQEMIVVLQVGDNEYFNDYASLHDYVMTLPNELGRKCIIRKFVYEEYGFLMSVADLFLGRSGANTVYQVGMNNVRAVFVPIPWVTHNEQYVNAMILAERGLAVILEERNCSAQELLNVIRVEIGKSTKNASTEKRTLKPQFPIDADKRLALEISKLAV